MEDEGKKLGGKHYVLVHGACHGAWCWFKVKPLLEEAGHRVTTLDMAASGIHPATIHQLHTLRDYCRPLIDFMGSLPDDQKVILVGHSLGGLNVAVIIEMFPYKIEAAVFLAAFLPDTHHHPAFVVDQLLKENLGTTVRLSPCDQKITGLSSGISHWQSQVRLHTIHPLRCGPSTDPA